MKIQVTIECQGCHKADATKKAVMVGAPETDKYAWKLCQKCATQKTPEGNQAWVIVGELKPVVREL